MPQHRPPVPIVIPAYKPGAKLVALVDALVARGTDLITVVDDGSGPAFAEWFEDIAQRGPVRVLRPRAISCGTIKYTG